MTILVEGDRKSLPNLYHQRSVGPGSGPFGGFTFKGGLSFRQDPYSLIERHPGPLNLRKRQTKKGEGNIDITTVVDHFFINSVFYCYRWVEGPRLRTLV